MAPERATRNSFVPDFKEDIFISYGHLDNWEHWVEDLAVYLGGKIRELLGTDDVRIWMDPKVDQADAPWDVLEEAIAGCAVFVPILSPRYIVSPSCSREVTQFRASVGESGTLKVGTTYRLVRVIKAPYATEPEALKGIESTGFHFYRRDPLVEGRIFEFQSKSNLDNYLEFRAQADELARSLAGLLQKLRQKFARPVEGTGRLAVFLAETTEDRAADREFIINELKDTYDLLPIGPLPRSVEALSAQLSADLSRCALSVHLLGGRFGSVPEGKETRSVPEIQLVQAAALRRLVWISQEDDALDERQLEFLNSVRSSIDAKQEVVATGGRQEFVQHLGDVLAEISRPQRSPVLDKAIYVVPSTEDLARPELKEMLAFISERGFRLELPVFQGDVEELHRAEEETLRETNAAIIYWGNARDVWVRARRQAILKVLATQEHGNNYSRALYLCIPKNDHKLAFYGLPAGKWPEVNGPPLRILGDCSEFTGDKLEPWLSEL